jgi:hypothetical protein
MISTGFIRVGEVQGALEKSMPCWPLNQNMQKK